MGNYVGVTKCTLSTFPNTILSKLHYIEKYILKEHHSLFKEYINENGLIEDYSIFINDFRSIELILLYNILNSNENNLHQKYHRSIVLKNLTETKTILKEIEIELINKSQTKYIHEIIKKKTNSFEIDYIKKIKGKEFSKNKKVIYFIQQENDGAIKIGISNNFKKRLRQLQTGSPYKLNILTIINGDEELEKQLHSKFAEYRLSGEWFKPVEKLVNYINKLEKPA